jgi:hypothetical protein
MTAAALPSTTWQTFRRAVLAYRPGATICVDHLRPALEAAQIPPAAYGALFKAACHAGLLETSGFTVPSRDPNARGRRVLQYRVVSDDPWAEAS